MQEIRLKKRDLQESDRLNSKKEKREEIEKQLQKIEDQISNTIRKQEKMFAEFQ